jgi:multidrug efflux pump subunit AcrA (membrane-fusion protein)
MPRFARYAPFAGLLILAACGRADADSTSGARPYRVGLADQGDIQVFVEETGLVEPERQIVVKSPGSGGCSV